MIDEISFNTATFNGHLDATLRALKNTPNVPCGGIPVLKAGDFLQLDPPSGVSLVHDMVGGSSCVNTTASAVGLRLTRCENSCPRRASRQPTTLRLFTSARKHDLHRNMRAIDDPSLRRRPAIT